MSSRAAAVRSLTIVALLGLGFPLQPGSATGAPEQQERQRGERQRRETSRQERLTLPETGSGRHLAFDVRPRDYRNTTRYVLEITAASGEVTTHDLQKPRLQRRTIVIALPQLEQGHYRLLVIAESSNGNARSKPLTLDLR